MELKERAEEILIVEDDIIVSRLHKFALSKMVDHEVRIALNGKEAIDHLDSRTESLGKILVLLDINMPVMNGWDFLIECNKRKYCEKIAVAIVTSSPFQEDARRAKKFEQVVGYYTKPLKPGHLEEIFERVEEQGFEIALKNGS